MFFSVIQFIVGAATGILGIMIYKGNTDLIHSYHQKNVKDKAAYGKAFGLSFCLLAVSMIAAGIIALTVKSTILPAIVTLFAGIIISLILLTLVQYKYNGGIF